MWNCYTRLSKWGNTRGPQPPPLSFYRLASRTQPAPPPLTPQSHVPYLAKGQQTPSPVGSLFAATSFTPASALYCADDNTPPTASGHSPSSLLPQPPKLSFTIPEPASQAKPVTIDPTPPESPIPTTGSAPPSPSQPGEPFVPDLDVSAYSTDYAQLRDQLRQRHLAPLESLSPAPVRAITGWTGAPLGPPPSATVANLRAVIHRAAATVPFHDLLEYRLFGQLEDPQFFVVEDLINDILRGSPVPQAHSADFINLPKKQPHGPIANGRPLTNRATGWKLTAALRKNHY